MAQTRDGAGNHHGMIRFAQAMRTGCATPGMVRNAGVWIALFLLLLSAPAAAESGMPDPPPPPEALPPGEAGPPDSWMDRTHSFFRDRTEDTFAWFDGFFGKTSGVDAARPDFVMRWTNEMRVEERGTPKFRTSLRANVHLPGVSRKLKLVISGESKPDPSVVLPDDPGNPGFNAQAPGTSFKQVSTEIRYEFIKTQRNYFFAGTGVRLVLPPQAFARVRYQFNQPFGDNNHFRFAVTPFWNSKVGFGETTDFSLERRIGPMVLVAWSNSGTISEDSSGLEWGSALSLAAQLSPKSAVSPSVGLSGPTRPLAVISNYRAAVKFRRNEFRPWFFWELEPEVNWPRDDLGGYRATYAGTLRAEVLFLGK
jgi:hypothetical protein